MELLDAIKKTPLLRPNALPAFAGKNLGIICFQSAFTHIPENLLNNSQAIFIIDLKYEQLDAMNDSIRQRTNEIIPIVPFNDVESRIDIALIFYHNDVSYHPIGHCYKYMRSVGYESFYTFMTIPISDTGMTFVHKSDYYTQHKNELEKVYLMLDDEESKSIFAARIRAISSGMLGYLKVSNYDEYFHPFVHPETDDVILDGGVSEYVESQIAFIKTIGPNGKYYGFEPDPNGFNTACERLKKSTPYENYKLIPFGLWDKRDKLLFEMLGLGTRISKVKNEDTIECNVISIDEFVKIHSLNKVDFIKLDVEGAELNTLKGAIETIKYFRPKLAVSLYHNLDDLYTIPFFLKEIYPDYKLYLGHHHSALHETILYAK